MGEAETKPQEVVLEIHDVVSGQSVTIKDESDKEEEK